MVERIRLPSGKEIDLMDVLKFCYDLSETDTQILLKLVKGNEYDVDELAKEMGLSKATVNRSLNKLVELGFIFRRRERRQSVGRPRYKYYVENPQNLIEKLRSDMEKCAEVMKQHISRLIESIE
ncbi:MAG TPA: MarR family transcriptional regulator [Pyrodictiaceae archaeon]|nr:MarR family transcriptional regulator [Pyrodictiaceae archaeon]HIQ10898.1 MarR family transcriptional regulator [Pyrodictium sp.]HIQ55600.1 MarR family transcriptional regulator [Pyrodictium sp.]